MKNSIGLLILRLVTGFSMILHSLPKIGHPASWLGDAVPAPLQFLAFATEFAGGFLLILGLLTPVVTFLMVSTMTVAVKEHFMWGDPLYRLTVSNSNEGPGSAFMNLPEWFVIGGGHSPAGSGSAELAFLFLFMALTLLFTGPGDYSVDNFIPYKKYLQKLTRQ